MNNKVNILQCDKCGEELERDGIRVSGYYSFKDLVSGEKICLCATCASTYPVIEFCREKIDVAFETDAVIVSDADATQEATPEEVEKFFHSDEPVFTNAVVL